MAFVRVRNTGTGHQYDVDEATLERRLASGSVELLNDDERWPPTDRPRPAKPNVQHQKRAAKSSARRAGESDPDTTTAGDTA